MRMPENPQSAIRNPQWRKAWFRLVLPALVMAVWPACVWAGESEESANPAKYLPINEEVKDEIAKADKLIEKQEWRKAIEICQKFIAAPAKGVFEVRPGVYGSAKALCEKKLRDLPDAGRLLYRTLYDPEAEALYRSVLGGRDVAAARRLVSEFALTSRGANGLNLLAGLLFESGDVYGALDCWGKWLDDVKADSLGESERRLTAAKIAVAAAKAGNNRNALNRAITLFGRTGAMVEVGDRKMARSEELEQFASSLWVSGTVPVSAAPAELDFERWSTSLRSGAFPVLNSSRQDMPRGGGRSAANYGCDVALSGGVLYVNAPDGPRAFDAFTGRPIWWRSTRNYDTNYHSGLRLSNSFCRVYSTADDPARKVVFASGGLRLDAYDAETGRPVWSKHRASLARIEAGGGDVNSRMSFCSPVVCQGGTAYALVETSGAEILLVALDRSTGEVRWSTAVGTSFASPSGYRVSVPASLAVVGSDPVFCSGRGVIGRCDASTGEIVWLAPYRRRPAVEQEGNYAALASCRFRPLEVLGDSMICMPPDGQELLFVAVSDGKVNWRKDVREGEVLFGAVPAAVDGRDGDSRLFVAGEQVRCLSAKNGSVLWTWPLPESGKGLGRVTDKGVIVATDKAVYVLDAGSGELVRSAPLDFRGAVELNVFCDGDSVVLAGPHELRVIGSRVRTKEIVAKSGDPSADPWLAATRARLLRSEGEHEKALEWFDVAIKAAKQKSASRNLATALEAEMNGLANELATSNWKAGRRLEGFEWMSRALLSRSRAAYECKLGYRSESGRGRAEPHTVVMASGDTVSGRLTLFESGNVTLVVRGEPWLISAAGVDRIVVKRDLKPARRAPGTGGYLITDDGEFSCTVESLRDDVLTVKAGFGTFQEKLAHVAVILLRGARQEPAPETLYVGLRNGDQVSGVIRSFDGTVFTLDIPFCGQQRINADEVYLISNRRTVATGSAGKRENTEEEEEDRFDGQPGF